MKILPLFALLLLGCDDDPGAAAGGACVTADLVAQCPVGTSPLVGAQAENSCNSAVGGVVVDGAGQATGQCYGVGSCRVICQFAVPCRCGVASVSRDGVVCASCEGAASCGDGVCEGGESPQSCPIDCGMVCNAGERRCDGERLQECSLQGRFDTLPCPGGEVCSAEGGQARCIRDPGIIQGGDAGVEGDGGAPPDDGRLIPGDGTWPVVAAQVTAPFSRAVGQRDVVIPFNRGGFALAMAQAGARTLWNWRLLPDDGMEGVGGVGTVGLQANGELALHHGAEYPAATADTYCAAYEVCYGPGRAECELGYQNELAAADGAWRAACIAAVGAGRCDVLFGIDGTCYPTAFDPHPNRLELDPNYFKLAGSQMVGVDAARIHLLAVDLDAGTTQVQEPVGDFRILAGPSTLALSANGRVAAAVAVQGTDQIIVVWDLATGLRRAALPRSVGNYVHIALNLDGQMLATVISESQDPEVDGVVSLWNLAEEKRIISIRSAPLDNTPGYQLLVFSPNGRELAIDVEGQTTAEIWQLGRQMQPTQRLPLNNEHIMRGVYAPDGVTLALAGEATRQVSLWNTQDGQRWRSLEPGQGNLREVRFSADGQKLLVMDQDIDLTFRVLGP